MFVADHVDPPAQESQQRQPEESVVERLRRKRIERNYGLYRIKKRRQHINSIINRINNRRLTRHSTLSQKADAPATVELEQRRRFRKVKRRVF